MRKNINYWIYAGTVCTVFAATAAQAAIDIRFDYTYDNGFFSGANEYRRLILDAATQSIEDRLSLDSLPSILPTNGNTWSYSIQDPRNTSSKVVIENLQVPSDTVIIFVGGADIGPLGLANIGDISFAGGAQWRNSNNNRVNSPVNFDSIGGGIIFDASANWYFGDTTEAPPSNKYDFFSVAAHEVFHILGFSISNAFAQDISLGSYAGANVQSVAGGPVALNSTWHWGNNVTFLGDVPLMNPEISTGTRRVATELDYAVLKDIGYTVTAAPIPEPSISTFLVAGLLGLFVMRQGSSVRH